MPHAEASTAPLLPCCLPPAPILSRSPEEELYVNEPRPHAQGLLRDVEGAPWRGFDAGGLHLSGPGGGISVLSLIGRDPQAAPQEAAGAYWAAGPPPRRRRAAGRGGPGRPRRAAASNLSWPPQIGPGLPKFCLSRAPQICAGLLRFGYSAEKGSTHWTAPTSNRSLSLVAQAMLTATATHLE